MKKFGLVFLVLLVSSVACKSRNTPRVLKRDVSIAIAIRAGNNATTNFINMDYFRLQVLDELEQFQSVNFVLVGEDENPEVILDLNIDNFILWPRDERVSRRRISRAIVVGKDAAGKPLYQTVSATVDLVQVQRRSNARFVTTLIAKGDPPLKFQRTFSPNYNYVNTYIDNIQGDRRAVDASISMSGGMGFEPMEDDFLLLLSKEEMLRRLSSELRKYYDTKTKVSE